MAWTQPSRKVLGWKYWAIAPQLVLCGSSPWANGIVAKIGSTSSLMATSPSCGRRQSTPSSPWWARGKPASAATAAAVLAAYALARMQFPGRNTILSGIVSLMVVPPVVLVVPLFLLMVHVGFINTLPSVIVVYVGLTIPLSVYLLTNFFQALPYEIEEAARIDGCSPLGVLWRIVLPLSAPALLTSIVVNAFWVWNELLIALVFLQSNESRTLVAGLTLFQGQFQVNESLVMTGALIATIPMLLLYLFGARFFIRGLVAGSGK